MGSRDGIAYVFYTGVERERRAREKARELELEREKEKACEFERC